MANILEREYKPIIHPCLYKDKIFRLYLEDANGEALIHCLVDRWTPSSYKRIKQLWEMHLSKVILAKGYSRIWAAVDTLKLAYFAHLFGFKDTENYVQDNEGTIRRLMVWPGL